MKLFFTKRFYLVSICLAVLFLVGYYFPLIFVVSRALFWLLLILLVLDIILLFYSGGQVMVERKVMDRLSNGDENTVTLLISNHYKFPVQLTLLEEIPDQLQIRDFRLSKNMPAGATADHSYVLRPTERGIYRFGHCNVLISSAIGLISRRIRSASPVDISVYPSFVHINKYELAAISDQLTLHGQKPIPRLGSSRDFDSIRPYVVGDDPRHINWKATAKTAHLQVNHFMDERSQNIYCVIDKSRSMKMPFEELSLLDYAINASLVLSYVALKKGDRPGLITFEDNPSTFLKASGQSHQIHKVIEALYHEKTSFREVDFTSLYAFVRQNLSQRSLLLLFSNFESIHSLERQLPYLKLLNRQHLLLVIFFQNTEVEKVVAEEARTIRDIYNHAIAFQMRNEKHLINEKLQNSGILTLYTAPENLSVDVINRYIEMKKKI